MTESERRQHDPAEAEGSNAGTVRDEAAGIAERVVVSPRTIDQHAFNELSSTLRSLVRDAASQNRVLLSATGEVRGLSEQLRAAAGDLNERVRTASACLPGLDERIARNEQLLAMAREELGARVREFRDLLSSAAMVDRDAISRDVRAWVAEDVASELRLMLDGATTAVNEVLSRGESQLHAMRTEAEGTAWRIERLRTDMESHAAELAGRVDSMISSLAAAVETSESRTRGILASLTTSLEHAAEQASSLDLATARHANEDLAEAVAKATEAALEMRELTAQIGQHREHAEAAGRTFATLASQAVRAGEDVGNRILAAAECIESLEQHLDRVRSRFGEIAKDADRKIEGIEALRASVAQAHEVGPRLASLVARAEELRRRDGERPVGGGQA